MLINLLVCLISLTSSLNHMVSSVGMMIFLKLLNVDILKILVVDMQQESLKLIISEPEWARKKHMREYAFNLIKRDISHIQFQADMRQANSQELTRLLDELSSTLNYYS